MNPEYVTLVMFFILTVQIVCNFISVNTIYIDSDTLNALNLMFIGLIWGMLIGKWMVLL